jgi:hypothetical protein
MVMTRQGPLSFDVSHCFISELDKLDILDLFRVCLCDTGAVIDRMDAKIGPRRQEGTAV